MKKISVLLAWVVICTFSLSLISMAQDASGNGPKISFDKETHDYGTFYVNGDGNCVFTFTNTGNEPLILSNVKAGCGCTVPDWPKEPILPGKSSTIKVKYTTVNRPHKINKSIVVTSNAIDKPTVVLRIVGEIIEAPEGFSPEKTLDKAGAPTSK